MTKNVAELHLNMKYAKPTILTNNIGLSISTKIRSRRLSRENFSPKIKTPCSTISYSRRLHHLVRLLNQLLEGQFFSIKIPYRAILDRSQR
jgi:hypothetical protein